MKTPFTYLILIALVGFNSCSWFETERKVSCISPGEYEYLEHDWVTSICTSELCLIYSEIWKELFIKRNNMTEEYFEEHISKTRSEIHSGSKGESFSIEYRVQNEWAIAEWGDGFVIKIAEDYNGYPEIGLPKGNYLTIDEIEAAIINKGFNSKISKAPKTGPIRFSSMQEALNSLIKEANVDTMCFNRVFLSVHTGTLTLEAFAAYEDVENGCIKGTIDLITGIKFIQDVSCDRIYSP